MLFSPWVATKCSPDFIKMALDVYYRGTLSDSNSTTVSNIRNKRQTLYGQLTVIPSEVSHSRSIRLSCNMSAGDETIITHCATLSVLVVSLIILLPLWGANLGSFILDCRLKRWIACMCGQHGKKFTLSFFWPRWQFCSFEGD